MLHASVSLGAPAPVSAQVQVSAGLPGLRPGPREPADLDHLPFSALVRVQTELGTKCTGFMIAPAVAITAAHCLYLPRPGHYIQPGSVHVLLGYRAGRYRAHARAVRLVIPDAYDPRQPARNLGHDRAALILDRPIAGPGNVLGVDAPSEGPLSVAAYDQDRAEIAVRSPPCTLTGRALDASGAPVLLHDCSVTHGASGAPVVQERGEKNDDGHAVAIGLVAAGDATDNIAVPLR